MQSIKTFSFVLFQADTYLCHGMKMGKDAQYLGKLLGSRDRLLHYSGTRQVYFFLLLE